MIADPTPLGSLVRLFADDGASIDFRVGHRWQKRPSDLELKTAILAGLDDGLDSD